MTNLGLCTSSQVAVCLECSTSDQTVTGSRLNGANSTTSNDGIESMVLDLTLGPRSIKIWVLCHDMACKFKNPHAIQVVCKEFLHARGHIVIGPQHNNIQHNNIQHNNIQHNNIQHNNIQHNNMLVNSIP